MSLPPEIYDHQRWLGYLQPDGLVVSPAALVDSGAIFDRNGRPLQERFYDHLRLHQSWDATSAPIIGNLPAFLTDFLRWQDEDFISKDAIPDSLTTYVPAYEETLRPTHAVVDPENSDKCLLLIMETSADDLDLPETENETGWHVAPSVRFEKLLRDTRVGIGLLSNGHQFRLIYAPSGENSGSLTFPVVNMAEIIGRPVLTGFQLLFDGFRLFQASEHEALPAILQKSRDYQANVSTDLAAQVLDGLYELLRGLQSAHGKSDEALLAEVLRDNPDAIYEAQLNVLMRLVFLLFSEDRGLMPDSSLYLQNYGVHALYDQLRKDREHFPDTMDLRYGAWARLLSLFRLVYDGSQHRDVRMPARSGYLFDPERFPFLEARSEAGQLADRGLPKIPDSTVCAVLEKLLYLKGEKLSYRTLDVEQIGSVYETMMGFRLLVATGPTIALAPKKKGGAPTNINLDQVLEVPSKDLKKWFKERTDRELTTNQLKALKDVESHTGILAALERIIAKNATPQIAHEGSLLLQPSDARRKSGSHYTPRKLTEPIVRKALEPILANLGDNPFPEQILDLKVCDPAVGSGAFLVEACRQLGDELVKAWRTHALLPNIPSDEDEVLHARRLVAQRCLYGVDRNRMASDLAKLALWLATLAKEHPFTFLDHSIRWGDSLVGLSKSQIRSFHWDTSHKTAQNPQLGEERLEKKLRKALQHREAILKGDDFLSPAYKAIQLAHADSALDAVRQAGDLTLLSFFRGSKAKERQEQRDKTLARWLLAYNENDHQEGVELKAECATAKAGNKPIHPFHWEIEFPEIFERTNTGFDAFIGNPPYAGKNNIAASNADHYPKWLQEIHSETHGNADLAAHFFRRAFAHTRQDGTVGFVTTNTIAQGDTRESSLTWMLRDKSKRKNQQDFQRGLIYQATRRYKWPGLAAVVVSIIHLKKGMKPSPCILDGNFVSRISSFLFEGERDETPKKLFQNSGKGFVGSYVLGMGFTFDDTDKKGEANSLGEMRRLLEKDPRNEEKIFPYLGGAELNTSPSHAHHRYTIDFKSIPESEASRWPDLLEILRNRVKPQRLKQGSIVNPERWWMFARSAADLYDSIGEDKRRVIAISRVGQHGLFTFIPTGTVYSEQLIIFPLESNASLAALQSRPHEAWARLLASSMKDDLRYTPSDCFETFPFPADWETNANLEETGESYYSFRAELMIRNNEGLTKTYNRFHKFEETAPDILKLRQLHGAMDRAVLDAYGWTDISTDCEFIADFTEEDEEGNIIEKNIRYRWPDEVRDEVLARLLALNAERYQEELNAGLHSAAAKKATRKKTRKAKKKSVKKNTTAQFERKLPQTKRTAASEPLLYSSAIIVSLLSEAGGSLSWKKIRDSFVMITNHNLMKEYALKEEQPLVSEWTANWNETLQTEQLVPALKLLLSGTGLQKDPLSQELRFELMDGPRADILPHHSYDAWLALRIASRLTNDELNDLTTLSLDSEVRTLVAS